MNIPHFSLRGETASLGPRPLDTTWLGNSPSRNHSIPAFYRIMTVRTMRIDRHSHCLPRALNVDALPHFWICPACFMVHHSSCVKSEQTLETRAMTCHLLPLFRLAPASLNRAAPHRKAFCGNHIWLHSRPSRRSRSHAATGYPKTATLGSAPCSLPPPRFPPGRQVMGDVLFCPQALIVLQELRPRVDRFQAGSLSPAGSRSS